MSWADVWDLFWKGLVILGGFGVVVGGIAAFVTKFFADRFIEKHKAALGQETERLKNDLAKETETHKWKLKKKELLFAKEMEAASAFTALHRWLEPRYRHPEMDWDEALEDVVESFTGSERRIRKFIAEHGAVIGKANRKDLDECLSIAATNQYAPAGAGGPDMVEAKKEADKFLTSLEKIEERFISELRK